MDATVPPHETPPSPNDVVELKNTDPKPPLLAVLHKTPTDKGHPDKAIHNPPLNVPKHIFSGGKAIPLAMADEVKK